MEETPVLANLDAGVLTLTLNRPQRLNAMSHQLIEEMTGQLGRARDDNQVRSVLPPESMDPIVVKQTGAKSVSIIAHSMGNQLLLPVLRDLKHAAPPTVAISQVILAAPLFHQVILRSLAFTFASVALTLIFSTLIALLLLKVRHVVRVLVEPGVRSTRGPSALTGVGPLCSKRSNRQKSVRPSPVPSISAVAYFVRARIAFIMTIQTRSVPSAPLVIKSLYPSRSVPHQLD